MHTILFVCQSEDRKWMSAERMTTLIEADSMMGREPIDFVEVFEKGENSLSSLHHFYGDFKINYAGDEKTNMSKLINNFSFHCMFH